MRIALTLALVLLATPAQAAACLDVEAAGLRCERWSATYDFPGGHATQGIDMAFDTIATEDLVYVTGQSWRDEKNHYDFVTIAYDPETGTAVWTSRYDGPGDEHDIPQSMALSPDGARLYVAGWVHMNPVGEGADYATVAYDAATGEELWDATYDGGPDDSAYGVAVSPDGEWVYVTGKSGSLYENMDLATVAYRAEDGTQAWVTRTSSQPGAGEDIGISPVVSADGETLYVTGSGGTTWMTHAYRGGEAVEGEPDPGTVLWTSTYSRGYAYWNALSPGGDVLYVSGSKHNTGGGLLVPDWDYAAMALDTATGEQLWMGTYAAPDPGLDVPYANALSGDRLYLTGSSRGTGVELNADMVTVAFDVADGSLAWSHRADNPAIAFEGGGDVAVSPDGATVYAGGWSATGFGGPGTTVMTAHDAGTGTPSWTARYHGVRAHDETDFIDAIAVAPDGGAVYATGRASYATDPDDPAGIEPGRNGADILTLAYEA